LEIIDISTKQRFTIVLKRHSGEETMICPACNDDRKKKNVRCFSWNHEKVVGYCNHCERKFGLFIEMEEKKVYKKPTGNGTPLSNKTFDWFKTRGISSETINRLNITETKNGTTWIRFNYFEGPDLVNVKSRNAKKEFRLESGCKLIFYNLNSLNNAKKCYIVEGEIDCLTLIECGFKEVVSVPNGAHRTNNNLQYLDNCIDYFEGIEEVYLLTDGDEPGVALRNELARRIGKEKCFFFEYPEGCKDVNDVLLKLGKPILLDFVSQKKEFPMEGVLTVDHLSDGIDTIFNEGYPRSYGIGNELDFHIKWRTGEWTVVTGSPGSGKSEVIDQISLILNTQQGWKCGVFSPENRPYQIHFWKLAHKLYGKMMKDFTKEDKEQAKQYLRSNYFWIDEKDPSLDTLLAKARELVKRKGIKQLIFDPWNQIEHCFDKGQTETQYVSASLSKISQFVVDFDVHVFLVAHPGKSRQTQGKLSLYDVAGSAHFFNKTYNGITVMRDYENDQTLINIEKVKFWFVGKAGGQVIWQWDLNKGTRFFDFDVDFVSSKKLEPKEEKPFVWPTTNDFDLTDEVAPF
jgi:twinkle protein